MKDWTGNGKSVFVCNGASNHSDGERQSEDYYATEPKAIHKLCAVEQFTDTVWECACGGGHMVQALRENGYKVYATDIVDRTGGGYLMKSRTFSRRDIRRSILSRTRHTESQRNSSNTRSRSSMTAERWQCSSNSRSWRVSLVEPFLRSTHRSGYGYSRSEFNARRTATLRPTSRALARRLHTLGTFGRRATTVKRPLGGYKEEGMKFEVKRTSMLLGTVDDGKPCEEAIFEGENHRLAHWTVQINNLDELIKFCGKYGETIIQAPQNDDPYPILEIYDDYRE